MTGETLETSADSERLLLDLFTEVAIIEHLVRVRMADHTTGLSAQQFGVVNYFVRQGKRDEKLTMLAWSFQVADAAMEATVSELQSMKLVEIDWVDGHRCVFLTDAGRQRHADAMQEMAPVILPIMADFPIDDLRVTAATLKEIRRTFDNLPDR